MSSKKSGISVLESDASIEGSVSCKGQLVIKGTLKGKLSGEEVVVARQGKLIADAKVTRMTVDGVFEGDAHVSQRLSILANGNCAGRIFCKDLMVESGGVLNGSVTYIKTEYDDINTKINNTGSNDQDL